MAVCIISNSDDVHAICVELALAKKGIQVTNWYWGDFPGIDRLSVAIESGGGLKTSVLNGPANEVALWIHRGLSPIAPPTLHPADVNFVINESYAVLNGMLNEFSREAFCVNPPDALRRLKSKINELSLAGRCGLSLPPTLFSNDPVAIRAFFQTYGGEVIAKYTSQMWWESSSNKSVHLTYTNRVLEKHITDDLQLSSCPSIFQKEVHKAFELRIVFMGATLFSIKIDSQRRNKSIDWRWDYQGMPPCAIFALPAGELRKVRAFIRASGLRYGSIDMIVDNQGNYIFLEVNETGQFLWIEDILPELPLLDCFAEFLISRDPEFSYKEGACPARCSEFDYAITKEAIKQRTAGHMGRVDRTKLIE